ncbi:restriction endonuclease subunit S [Desulfonatronospira sp.]|uniref:restriction endonuclease subunit S n=1 Tax=Desulfonatronospira sp. TaxID=1962951 RepID=UPI0025B813D6|nr:restriction endonuclease subunit S [Desulfonatronospira sp.]
MKWPLVCFSDVVYDITSGNKKVKKKDFLTEGDLPVVDQGQKLVAGFTYKKNFFRENLPVIIFGDHTRIFKYIDFPFALGADGVKALRPINCLNPKFVYFFCLTLNIPPKGYSRHYSLLKQKKIPIPSLSEQVRIVEILDQADHLRKMRIEADNKAERILPALFIKMFGEPATNPKGWPVKMLGDPEVAEINPKFANGIVSDDTEVSFIPMADVDGVWGKISFGKVKKYSEVKKGFTKFKNNDVLFAKITPCMQNGKAAIARNLVNGIGFGSTEFHVLRPRSLAVSEWLYALVRMKSFRKQAECSFTGTAGQQRVPTTFLARYEVGCPPIDLQQKFSKAVQRFHESMDMANRGKDKVEDLFSILLHHAFSGDLTASWRQDHMKELLQEMEIQTKALAL